MLAEKTFVTRRGFTLPLKIDDDIGPVQEVVASVV